MNCLLLVILFVIYLFGLAGVALFSYMYAETSRQRHRGLWLAPVWPLWGLWALVRDIARWVAYSFKQAWL